MKRCISQHWTDCNLWDHSDSHDYSLWIDDMFLVGIFDIAYLDIVNGAEFFRWHWENGEICSTQGRAESLRKINHVHHGLDNWLKILNWHEEFFIDFQYAEQGQI